MTFDFGNYKHYLTQEGVVLNEGLDVSCMEGVPEELFPLYENFYGMKKDDVDPYSLIELYPVEEALTITKLQIEKFPSLKNDLLFIFGDVMLGSQFLAFRRNYNKPVYLFEDELCQILKDPNTVEETFQTALCFEY